MKKSILHKSDILTQLEIDIVLSSYLNMLQKAILIEISTQSKSILSFKTNQEESTQSATSSNSSGIELGGGSGAFEIPKTSDISNYQVTSWSDDPILFNAYYLDLIKIQYGRGKGTFFFYNPEKEIIITANEKIYSIFANEIYHERFLTIVSSGYFVYPPEYYSSRIFVNHNFIEKYMESEFFKIENKSYAGFTVISGTSKDDLKSTFQHYFIYLDHFYEHLPLLCYFFNLNSTLSLFSKANNRLGISCPLKLPSNFISLHLIEYEKFLSTLKKINNILIQKNTTSNIKLLSESYSNALEKQTIFDFIILYFKSFYSYFLDYPYFYEASNFYLFLEKNDKKFQYFGTHRYIDYKDLVDYLVKKNNFSSSSSSTNYYKEYFFLNRLPNCSLEWKKIVLYPGDVVCWDDNVPYYFESTQTKSKQYYSLHEMKSKKFKKKDFLDLFQKNQQNYEKEKEKETSVDNNANPLICVDLEYVPIHYFTDDEIKKNTMAMISRTATPYPLRNYYQKDGNRFEQVVAQVVSEMSPYCSPFVMQKPPEFINIKIKPNEVPFQINQNQIEVMNSKVVSNLSDAQLSYIQNSYNYWFTIDDPLLFALRGFNNQGEPFFWDHYEEYLSQK